MRLTLPLPYGEVTVTVSRTRQARPLFWFLVLSTALHILVISLVVRFALQAIMPQIDRQPIMVSLSSALRIDRRARPQPAAAPAHRPRQQPSRVRTQVAVAAKTATARSVASPSPQPRPSVAKAPAKDRIAEQLQRDTRELAQTAARLSAQDSPLSGLATPSAMPASPKRYTLDISGAYGKPQPEGILYPIKRWVEGQYVYYYVRYLAYYSDGTSETGSVPWPIRYARDADPFAHGIHHMPLPGPPSGFVLQDDVSMDPLVQNCYDHRYQYCPIERRASP